MHRILFVLVTLIFLDAQSAQAFNRRRCSKTFDGSSKSDGLGRNERHWAKMFSSSTSSSQFTTSTGNCKLIGGISKSEREFFIADNSQFLIKDIVHAEGDYLAAIGILYNCDRAAHEQMALKLQQNVTRIFGENLDHGPAQISDELDGLMESDLILKNICSQGA